MKDITLLELLKSGAHFGHTTSRWNPRMKPYIFTVRNNIHILDLAKTREGLLKAASFLSDKAAQGGTVLFVGTKRQTKAVIQQAAESCGQPFVTVRWLGGTFTNFRTIQKTIRKLEKLEDMKATGQLEAQYTKKERLLMEREMIKLQKLFQGIKGVKKLPDAIFVGDINHDATAVLESRKSRIPVVGLLDSNSNPEMVDYAIPCNDDATRAVELVAHIMADAIREGRSRFAPAGAAALPQAPAAA